MFTVPVNRLDDLQRLRTDIDRLSGGLPSRSVAWLSSWAEAYGQGMPADRQQYELCSLAIHDPNRQARMIGFAPFCHRLSRRHGLVLQWLGAGEVCSDYMSLFAEPDQVSTIVDEVAQWLLATDVRRWDVIDLDGVAADDVATRMLMERLHAAGHQVYQRSSASTWIIPLPNDWDSFLKTLSKSHRKQVRRAVRNHFDTGAAELHIAGDEQELAEGFEIFRRLHVERRQALGQTGCFVSRRFAQFFDLVARRLFEEGQLKLTWLTHHGRPVASDFNLYGAGSIQAYQGGFDPNATELQPGWLLTIATLRRAIEQGLDEYDFLRGDEPYKSHWRAQPRSLVRYRVVSQHARLGVRHGLWLASEHAKSVASGQWRSGWQCLTETEPSPQTI